MLEDFKLICLGEEPISNREMFLIEDLKLNKKNITFENVDDFKLAKYYSNATALLYPSKNEGFWLSSFGSNVLWVPSNI